MSDRSEQALIEGTVRRRVGPASSGWPWRLYAVLAVLVWFTMDAGKVLVMGKPVEMRLIPLIIIGGLVLRTVLARSAEKIRRGGERQLS